MSPVRTFITKIWRITCAHAIPLAGGISLLIFVEKYVYMIALLLTIASFVIFYVSAYREYGDIIEMPINAPVSLAVFIRRIIKITLDNALVIVAGVTYLLFVTGLQMIYLSLITIISFILHYIDAYHQIAMKESIA